jgi:NADPH-dependent F420 reductase
MISENNLRQTQKARVKQDYIIAKYRSPSGDPVAGKNVLYSTLSDRCIWIRSTHVFASELLLFGSDLREEHMTNQFSAPLPSIAILGGTGKQGPGLAMRWASVGYPVIIGSRQQEKALATANELNTRLNLAPPQPVIQGMENGPAARLANICVLTVVQAAHQAAMESLKDDLQGRILVDATARVDFLDPRPPAPPAAARSAQEFLGPGVRVVAAFQNTPAHILKKNLGGSLSAAVLVCADDLDAADQVINLSEAGGMRAYYAGNLDNAIVVEGLTSLLISMNKRYGVKTASIGITGIDR